MPEGPENEADRARDAARLKELETRLKARQGNTPEMRDKSSFSQANIAWRMVTELVAGLLLGFVLGYGLDYLFGTLPIFLIIFVLFGLAGGIKALMGTARELGKNPAEPGDDKGE